MKNYQNKWINFLIIHQNGKSSESSGVGCWNKSNWGFWGWFCWNWKTFSWFGPLDDSWLLSTLTDEGCIEDAEVVSPRRLLNVSNSSWDIDPGSRKSLSGMSISATAAATSAASSGLILKSLSKLTPKELGETPPDRIPTLWCVDDEPITPDTGSASPLLVLKWDK